MATDSVDARLDLAGVRVTGNAGDEIWLVVASNELLPGNWASRHIIAAVDEEESRISIRDALDRVRVYRFQDSRTVVLHYALARGGSDALPASLRVEQVLTGTARVADARTPWVHSARVGASASINEARCSASAPGTVCGIAVSITPYFVGSPFGEFQNPGGTGASQPIQVSFNPPVNNVAVSIADPDFVGNQMTVNTLFGAAETFQFQGDNQPGTYTEYQIITGASGVISVDLVPAPNDYVAYFGLSFSIGDSIVVTCSASSVAHAGQVSCSAASSNPSLTLQVDEWRFIGGPGNAIRVTEVTQAATWAGPLVATGTISASGVLSNGARGSGNRAVTVTPRNWTSLTGQFTVEEQIPSGLPTRPDSIGKLGNTGLPVPPTGAWIFDDGVVTLPAGGPNAGVMYLTKVPINLLLRVRVNRTALSVNSDFYNRQFKSASGGKCGRADVVPFIPVVEQHEGLSFEPGSHTERYRTKLNAIAGPATEGIVGMDMSQLQTNADAAVGPLYTAAADSSGHADDVGQRPVYCTFRFF